MLLRIRVSLPDRPGALGQVARTLGAVGADIVQLVVLERAGGRAVDDVTVLWPAAAGVERMAAGLAAAPGVRLEGMWPVVGAAATGSYDAQLLAQIAGNPDDGLATLVDGVPGLLGADWAAAVAVPSDWAEPGRPPTAPVVMRASWRGERQELVIPEVTPLRPRVVAGRDGTRYAAAPFERAGLVLLAARVEDQRLCPAPFHATELDRLAQLVRAAAVVLSDRLESGRTAVR